MISEASSPLRSRRGPHRRSPLGPSLRDHSTRFKGVRMRSWGRWVSEIRIPHSRDKIWLGSYSMPDLAARAYDTAYLLLRGPSASTSLNLSDSSDLITPHLAAYTDGRQVITRRTIQTAAAEIANAIADVIEPPLQLIIPAADEEQGRAKSSEKGNGEESCRDTLKPNSTEEECLQDIVSKESRWIYDVLSLLSPREKTSSSFLSASAPASNRLQGSTGSLSCTTNLDEQRQELISASSLAVCDEFQQALQDWLAQDGFAPMSHVVTTRESFATDVAPPSDALWSYP